MCSSSSELFNESDVDHVQLVDARGRFPAGGQSVFTNLPSTPSVCHFPLLYDYSHIYNQTVFSMVTTCLYGSLFSLMPPLTLSAGTPGWSWSHSHIIWHHGVKQDLKLQLLAWNCTLEYKRRQFLSWMKTKLLTLNYIQLKWHLDV